MTSDREFVTVLVADDSTLYRTAAGHVVEAADGFCLVGEASSGEEAVRLAASLAPDMVLMDRRMPGLGGPAAAQRIARARPETMVVLLSAETDDESTVLPLRAEARTLDKRELSPRLLAAIWAERHAHVREH